MGINLNGLEHNPDSKRRDVTVTKFPNNKVGQDVSVLPLTAQQPFYGSVSVEHTFSKQMQGFCIINDGNADLTFTINEETYTVKSKETFNEYFKPFTTVNIVTTGAFRAYGLGV